MAAVEMDPAPLPGEPVMYWDGPELPAEVTTVTPAAAALVAATAEGSSARPKGEPSDMLMTLAPAATAISIASTVTSVEPSQPKTRKKYSSASGATPGPMRKSCSGVVESYGPSYVVPSAFTPKPVAVPDTCEPCP